MEDEVSSSQAGFGARKKKRKNSGNKTAEASQRQADVSTSPPAVSEDGKSTRIPGDTATSSVPAKVSSSSIISPCKISKHSEHHESRSKRAGVKLIYTPIDQEHEFQPSKTPLDAKHKHRSWTQRDAEPTVSERRTVQPLHVQLYGPHTSSLKPKSSNSAGRRPAEISRDSGLNHVSDLEGEGGTRRGKHVGERRVKPGEPVQVAERNGSSPTLQTTPDGGARASPLKSVSGTAKNGIRFEPPSLAKKKQVSSQNTSVRERSLLRPDKEGDRSSLHPDKEGDRSSLPPDEEGEGDTSSLPPDEEGERSSLPPNEEGDRSSLPPDEEGERSRNLKRRGVAHPAEESATRRVAETGKEVQVPEHPQDQASSSARSPTPPDTVKRHTENGLSADEYYKCALTQFIRQDVLETFPDLHSKTYIVPPVLFSTSRSEPYPDPTSAVFVSVPTLQSDARADEAMERFLSVLQEIGSSADPTTEPFFVVLGFNFDEYLNKQPPRDLLLKRQQDNERKGAKEEGEYNVKVKDSDPWQTDTEEETKKKAEKGGDEEGKQKKKKKKLKAKKKMRGYLPFPRPRDLHAGNQRGDVDLLIVHKKWGIIFVEVKAVGDTVSEVHDDRLENVTRVLERALLLMRKEREVIRYITSDISCDLPVSAMLVLPNLQRELLKAAITADPGLEKDMATCLQSTLPLEDACLCADDLPAKHSPVTDDDVRRFSRWCCQNWPSERQMQTPMEDDVYEEIIGRLVGPLSTMKIVAPHPRQLQQQTQRVEVRTLGQAVAETARRFSTLTLLPWLANLAWQCPEERVVVVGPPGSGKRLALIGRGVRWAREGRLVCIVTLGSAPSPVALVICDQIKKRLTMESAGQEAKPGEILLDSIQCRGSSTQLKKRCENLVSRISHRPQEDRGVGFILGELLSEPGNKEKDTDGNDSGYDDVIECLCSLAPSCGFWCADVWQPSSIPNTFSLQPLRPSVRCPPAVQVLLKMTQPSRDERLPAGVLTSSSSSVSSSSSPSWPPLKQFTYVTHSTALAPYSLPTTGVRNKLMSHHGHLAPTVLDCGQCAKQLAEYLKRELRVGQDIAANDVLILTADTSALSAIQDESLPRFARDLRESGLDVKVIADVTDHQHELAFPTSDKMIVTSCNFVSGLESKVIVFIPAGSPRDHTTSCREPKSPPGHGRAADAISPKDQVHGTSLLQATDPYIISLHQDPSDQQEKKLLKEHNKTDTWRTVLQSTENRDAKLKDENEQAWKCSSKKPSSERLQKRTEEAISWRSETVDNYMIEDIANYSDMDSEGEEVEEKGTNGGLSTSTAGPDGAQQKHLTDWVLKRRCRSCLPSSEPDEIGGSAAEEGCHFGSVTSYETRLGQAVDRMSQSDRDCLWRAASRTLGHAVVFCYSPLGLGLTPNPVGLPSETGGQVSSKLSSVHSCHYNYV